MTTKCRQFSTQGVENLIRRALRGEFGVANPKLVSGHLLVMPRTYKRPGTNKAQRPHGRGLCTERHVPAFCEFSTLSIVNAVRSQLVRLRRGVFPIVRAGNQIGVVVASFAGEAALRRWRRLADFEGAEQVEVMA